MRWGRFKKAAHGCLWGGVGAFALTAACASGVFGEPHFVSAGEVSDASPMVTFTGLHVYEDGRATVYVDLTRATSVQVEQKGKDVSFLLSGAKVRNRNNKNPLIAEHFQTNVLRARLVEEKGGVRLVVQLREDVHPAHDMNTSSSGARFHVDIPPPSGR